MDEIYETTSGGARHAGRAVARARSRDRRGDADERRAGRSTTSTPSARSCARRVSPRSARCSRRRSPSGAPRRSGGMTMGADPVACAALAGGAQAKAFFVRKDAKAHGLQRRIEGPPLDAGDRCVVVEDVVTTGGSTLAAIEALQRGRPRDLRRHQRARPARRRRRGDRAGRRRALRRAHDDRRHLPGPPRPRPRRP